MMEGNQTLSGEYPKQYTDDVLQDYMAETYIMC